MRALAITLVLYGLALAGALAWLAVVGRSRGPRAQTALVVVQLATTLLVVVDAVRSVGVLDGSDLVIHFAYLATAVFVLPVSFTTAGVDRQRWGNAAMAFAVLLLVVVVLRVQQTGVVDA